MKESKTESKWGNRLPSDGWQFSAAVILLLIGYTTVKIDGVPLYTVPDKLSMVLSSMALIFMIWDFCNAWKRRNRSSVQQDEFSCLVEFNGYTVDLFLCEDQKTLGLTVEHKHDDTSTDLFINEHLQVSPTAAA